MKDTVMVFTSKPLETIVAGGGSGNWLANRDRLVKHKYIILTKSDTYAGKFPADGVTRGTAFLIGKLSGVKDAPIPNGVVIQFNEYAEINVPNAWVGNRNPVAYIDIEDFEAKHKDFFSLEALSWLPFPEEKVEAVDMIEALTIDQAKKGIAKQLGIDPSCIEIRITA